MLVPRWSKANFPATTVEATNSNDSALRTSCPGPTRGGGSHRSSSPRPSRFTIRRSDMEGAGGMPPALGVSGGEFVLGVVEHGRVDRIDQGRRAIVNGGHTHAERLRVVQPAGDVVDGAQRQV